MITATQDVSLKEFFDGDFLLRNPQIGEDTALQYRIAVNMLDKWNGSPVSVSMLTDTLLLRFLKHLKDSGRAAKTVNGKRGYLLTIWKNAYRLGLHPNKPPTSDDVPKYREPKRTPLGWTIDELKILKAQCKKAPQIPQFGEAEWTGDDWLFLCLLIWDTAHRLDCLLEAPVSALDMKTGRLRIPAELLKQNRDSVKKVKRSTLDVAERLNPNRKSLVAWPMCKRWIWYRFEKDILIPSGLPYDRKHKFHCLRRSSISHVCAAGGKWEAMRHAEHTDMSVTDRYLDPSIAFPDSNAVDLLPEI